MDEALNIGKTLFKKGKVLKEDIVLVRREKTQSLKKYSENDVYEYLSYLSFTISKNLKPEIYGEYLNLILVSKGTKILLIENITQIEQEFEVLFDIGTRLEFLGQDGELLLKWKFVVKNKKKLK
ncbi:ADP-ribosyltransferase [Methanobrevibacter sp. DSM 116169]|uniref:ADP-ribosyltransferase n=1 Tax=Methanobrevibacter sp. DSM 116169 TaxID=3242727 RepID=UPI0038FC07EB